MNEQTEWLSTQAEFPGQASWGQSKIDDAPTGIFERSWGKEKRKTCRGFYYEERLIDRVAGCLPGSGRSGA
jgi:hypothetical protein